ncbi:MAG: NifB/NifX family molybdenum-iron cluster-binding protein [Thermoplasmatota archaeon]
MKVAVPTTGDRGLDEQVGEHFGRVPTYTIVDLDSNKVTVIDNTSHHKGGQRYPPELLAEHGVDMMLCRGLGRRAIQMFTDLGIDVCIGATGTVRDAIQAFKADRLQSADTGDACTRHAFHGEDGHH